MVPRWVTKALAVAPAVVVSTLITVLVGAVLPPLAGLVVFVGGLLLLAMLLAGRLEPFAARVLFFSRPLRPDEAEDLAPAVTLLCRQRLGPPLIDLRVSAGSTGIDAEPLGRHTVLVSAGLVDAAGAGRLPPDQVAAVITHAAALTRGGWARSDTAIAFWTLPWQVLHGVAVAVAQVGRLLPLVSTAWRLRGVVGGIAVLQFLQLGHPGFALAVAAIEVISYAMPVCERRWQHLCLEAGDRELIEVGLGPSMAVLLGRYPTSRALRARTRVLDGDSRQARSIGPVIR